MMRGPAVRTTFLHEYRLARGAGLSVWRSFQTARWVMQGYRRAIDAINAFEANPGMASRQREAIGMDPNATLRRLRSLAQEVRDVLDADVADMPQATYLERLKDAAIEFEVAFSDLDTWLANGGSLPTAWHEWRS